MVHPPLGNNAQCLRASGGGRVPWPFLGLGLWEALGLLQCGGAESALDKEGLKSLPALVSCILGVKKHDAVLELLALALCILGCFLFKHC